MRWNIAHFVVWMLPLLATCITAQEKKTIEGLRAEVKRLETRVFEQERLLRLVMPRIPKDAVQDVNQDLAKLFHSHLQRYRLTQKAWTLRLALAEKGATAKFASLKEEIRVAREDLEKLTGKRLEELENLTAKSEAEFREVMADPHKVIETLKKAEQRQVAKQAADTRNPAEIRKQTLDRAIATCRGWIESQDAKLHSFLVEKRVDRDRVDRVLLRLQQLVRGRARLANLSDAPAIDAELQRLRMIHLGIDRRK